MNDNEILHRITQLVDEEHELMKEDESNGLDDDRRERMQALQVNLDQCWDLLRQRRARRHAGQDPDEAQVRDAGTVENYKQ
jgi:hypothetical protein